MTDQQTTESTGTVLLALRIAADLVGTCGSDVKTTTRQGLDGHTDCVTITTDDHTVTVTPRLAYTEYPDPTPAAFNTPPPYVGMTHPPM